MSFRKIFKFLLGPVAGQVIALAVTPFLVASYGVGEFGEYALFLAYVGLFLAVTTFRIDAYVFKIKDDVSEVLTYSNFSIFVAMFFCIAVFFLFVFLGNEFAIFISLTLFFQGVGNCFSNSLILIGKQNVVSLSRFLLYFLASFFQVVLSWWPFFDYRMIVSYTLASFIYFLLLSCSKSKSYKSVEKVGKIKIRELMRFSFYNSFSVCINSFSSQAVPISLGLAFGAAYVGLYSYFNRVVVMPSVFVLRMLIPIANSELITFYKQCSFQVFKKHLTKYMSRGLIFGSFMLSVCALVAYLYASFFEDQELINALRLFPYVLPLVVFQCSVLAVSQLLGIVGKEKLLLKIEVMRFLGLSLCLAFAFFMNVGFEDYILMTSFVGMGFYLLVGCSLYGLGSQKSLINA